jgi:AGCS family alanine or glycine:cation symporter
MMGIFEVFADTIILCTLTALVILVGVGEEGAVGTDFMTVTLSAYEAVLGPFAGSFMAIAVLLFGFATVVCWAHYGMESVSYLSRSTVGKRLFCVLYIAAVFLGAVVESGPIWQVTDLAVGGMTLINLTALVLMSRRVVEETFPEKKRSIDQKNY